MWHTGQVTLAAPAVKMLIHCEHPGHGLALIGSSFLGPGLTAFELEPGGTSQPIKPMAAQQCEAWQFLDPEVQASERRAYRKRFDELHQQMHEAYRQGDRAKIAQLGDLHDSLLLQGMTEYWDRQARAKALVRFLQQ